MIGLSKILLWFAFTILSNFQKNIIFAFFTECKILLKIEIEKGKNIILY
jgi:hypothetical protein